MLDQSEIDRLDEDGIPTPLPGVWWVFELDLGDHPESTLAKIRDVVRRVINQDGETWPDDNYWKANLPRWLISRLPEISREEADRLMAETPRERWDELPWDFGSWLDNIREREWKWWGCECSGRKGKLILEVTDVPPRVDAFRQILLAAGGTILRDHWNLDE
jgi:hypothetical protein